MPITMIQQGVMLKICSRISSHDDTEHALCTVTMHRHTSCEPHLQVHINRKIPSMPTGTSMAMTASIWA